MRGLSIMEKVGFLTNKANSIKEEATKKFSNNMEYIQKLKEESKIIAPKIQNLTTN